MVSVANMWFVPSRRDLGDKSDSVGIVDVQIHNPAVVAKDTFLKYVNKFTTSATDLKLLQARPAAPDDTSATCDLTGLYDQYVGKERRQVVAAHQFGGSGTSVPSQGRICFVTSDNKIVLSCYYNLPVQTLTEQQVTDKIYGDDLAPLTCTMQCKCPLDVAQDGCKYLVIGLQRMSRACFFQLQAMCKNKQTCYKADYKPSVYKLHYVAVVARKNSMALELAAPPSDESKRKAEAIDTSTSAPSAAAKPTSKRAKQIKKPVGAAWSCASCERKMSDSSDSMVMSHPAYTLEIDAQHHVRVCENCAEIWDSLNEDLSNHPGDLTEYYVQKEARKCAGPLAGTKKRSCVRKQNKALRKEDPKGLRQVHGCNYNDGETWHCIACIHTLVRVNRNNYCSLSVCPDANQMCSRCPNCRPGSMQ